MSSDNTFLNNDFMRDYVEKHGSITKINNNVKLTIKDDKDDNIIKAFIEFFNIPYEKMDNTLTYSNVNIIDLLGILYKNVSDSKDELYLQFMNLINNERPILKFLKSSPDAITPLKANYSDVGHDLSIISIHSIISDPITKLYNTGIKLNIPIGYYVEIVPRSSISKSGYMLANSIGIIDCSYKGELLVALTKINQDAPDITFPFRCCQLIMRKQIFQELEEVSDIETSKRSDGGFGSSNKQ